MRVPRSRRLLILDEPEITLHPHGRSNMQSRIVRLQTVLNLNVVLTTHTPYFFVAMEPYARQYKVPAWDYFILTDLINGTIQLTDVTANTSRFSERPAKPLRIWMHLEKNLTARIDNVTDHKRKELLGIRDTLRSLSEDTANHVSFTVLIPLNCIFLKIMLLFYGFEMYTVIQYHESAEQGERGAGHDALLPLTALVDFASARKSYAAPASENFIT